MGPDLAILIKTQKMETTLLETRPSNRTMEVLGPLVAKPMCEEGRTQIGQWVQHQMEV